MSAALATLLPGFVGTTLPSWLEKLLREGLGGVCIFGENIESREQLSALTQAIRRANPQALIAIDEEGGDVTRLYYDQGSPYPGNALLGRVNDLAYTRSVAESVGFELRSVGINLNFAPDVDINSNPDNPVIGVRSFGSDTSLVAAHSAAWVEGHESTAVAVSAKHFPGHGDTALDSHLALPVIDRSLNELRSRELVPFAASIAAGARSIMTSHILLPQIDPDNPATFSSLILGDILREELGFEGVIVSDALDMKGASGEIGIPAAAARALAAGCDLLCIGTKNTAEQLEAITAAIESAIAHGTLTRERIADAASRNIHLAEELAAQAAGTPVEAHSAEPEFSLDRSVSAFDVQPAARVSAQRTLVAIETVANIAIGVAPWGPRVDSRVSFGEALPSFEGQLVLVGKNNHRHDWVRALIDDARSRFDGVLVVDMGWPGDSREYADVATFGASRHAGLALEVWLEGESR